jgi:hypothetical protein
MSSAKTKESMLFFGAKLFSGVAKVLSKKPRLQLISRLIPHTSMLCIGPLVIYAMKYGRPHTQAT